MNRLTWSAVLASIVISGLNSFSPNDERVATDCTIFAQTIDYPTLSDRFEAIYLFEDKSACLNKLTGVLDVIWKKTFNVV